MMLREKQTGNVNYLGLTTVLFAIAAPHSRRRGLQRPRQRGSDSSRVSVPACEREPDCIPDNHPDGKHGQNGDSQLRSA